MKIQYFSETDTLYIEFKGNEIAESRDLDENTVLDLDQHGNVCGFTLEHAASGRMFPTSLAKPILFICF